MDGYKYELAQQNRIYNRTRASWLSRIFCFLSSEPLYDRVPALLELIPINLTT